MRLETLRLKNFRGYEDQTFHLHPEFNLIIGENGSGKTSFLEGAAVAIGSWLLGFPGVDSRNIRKQDVRIVRNMVQRRYYELPQYPVCIEAVGYMRENDICEWSRSLDREGGITTRRDADKLISMAGEMVSNILNNYEALPLFKKEDSKIEVLPLIRYFGAGRLWESVRYTDLSALSKYKKMQPSELAEHSKKIDKILFSNDRNSPFYGYHMAVDGRCSAKDIVRWVSMEHYNEFSSSKQFQSINLVFSAIRSMMPEVDSVVYEASLKSILLNFNSNKQYSFDELSDGYRNIVAMAADLAIKALILNPHLGEKALELTPGVVLIDELDLHLHPRWQRRVIEDLRRTFPKVQFICTTHSPFLIQSLRSGEELIVLDGQPTAQVDNMPIDKIAQGLMGVDNTETSARYDEMKSVAKNYLAQLEQGIGMPSEKLGDFLEELAKPIAPYANNPAFQAFLEMKRAVKLGV